MFLVIPYIQSPKNEKKMKQSLRYKKYQNMKFLKSYNIFPIFTKAQIIYLLILIHPLFQNP